MKVNCEFKFYNIFCKNIIGRVMMLSILICIPILVLFTRDSSCKELIKSKHILILNSYNKGLAWTDDVVKGMEEGLQDKSIRTDIQIEYMDTKRISDDEHFANLFALYRHKFSNQKFDMILSSDDDAFNFLLKNRDSLFPGTPFVFCGVNNFENAIHPENKVYTGVMEEIDIEGTLDIALKLHPQTKEIVVINDTTTTGLVNKKSLLNLISSAHYPLKIVFLEDLKMRDIQKEVRKIRVGSIVLLMPYTRDGAGKVFSPEEAASLISSECKVPIYSLWDVYLGKGIVGGSLNSGYYQGKTAGHMALLALKGKKIESIPLVKGITRRYMFDYKQLERFGINLSDLPGNSIVINKPLPFYAEHKTEFLVIGNALLAMLLVILILLFKIAKRRKTEKELLKAQQILEARVNERTSELLQSEERYRVLFNSSRDIVLVSQALDDGEIGKFIEVNDNACNILDYTREELLDMTPFDIASQSVTATSSIAERIFAEKHILYERIFVTKDGQKIPVEINAHIFSLHGKPIMLSVARDISERKRMEEELRKERDTVRSIFASSPYAVWISDLAGNILECNQEAIQLFRYTRQEILGSNVFVFLAEKDRQKAAVSIQEALEKGFLKNIEYSLVRKDGTAFIGEVSVSIVYDQDRPLYLVGVVIDITEHRQMEKDLTRAKEIAENANRAKSSFLATMSHEIRTPLNGIIAMASLLQQTKLGQRQREFVDILESSGKALLTLISDVLDFSKIESEKVQMEAENFDLHSCIEDAIGMIGTIARSKNLNLLYRVEKDVPNFILGDQLRLRQVITNLLSNAVKFTHQGEVLLSVTKVAEQKNGMIELLFKVIDTGIGIAPDRIKHLFDAFAQADSSITRKYGGTGLGLAICKRLVKLLGGEIGVESKAGIGSTFHFTIQVTSGKIIQERVYLYQKSAELADRKALIISDNHNSAGFLQLHLSEWGIRVESVFSLDNVSEIITEKGKFDIIIIDLLNSCENAFALGTNIREKNQAINQNMILVCQTEKSKEFSKELKQLFSAYLIRPFKLARLFETLYNALMGRRTLGVESEDKLVEDSVNLSNRIPLEILVVEDNLANQKVMFYILEEMGYKPRIVGDGMQALREITDKQFDIVFMDIWMPEVDGFEATRQIIKMRNGNKGPIVIAMTANMLKDTRDMCFEAGMDDYIAKPVLFEEIRAMLEKWGSSNNHAQVSNGTSFQNDSIKLEKMILDFKVINSIRMLGERSNHPLLREIADLFFTQAEQSIKDIQGFIENGESGRIAETAHKLSGTALNIGAKAFAVISKNIQKKAERNDLDGIEMLLAQLKETYRITKEKLSTELAG